LLVSSFAVVVVGNALETGGGGVISFDIASIDLK